MRYSFLKDKVIIVTGASSGIGLATVKLFASHGAKVVMAARSIDKLEQLKAEMPEPANVLCVKTDVAVEEDCKNLVEETVKTFGRIDVLLNNAGISMRAMFIDLDLDVIKRLMDTNFWGTVYCTKYALPYLLESKGSVVGVISTAGYLGLPGRTGYSASKFAIRGFLSTLRVEHRYDGLHVMVFAPGFTASDIRNKALLADGTPQGKTPRDEKKMMTAEKVAKKMALGLKFRKNEMLLTPVGKITKFFTFALPKFSEWCEYKLMAKEPESPIKKNNKH
ncbi:MAG: SDR family oxidoreductase [Bacteroidales bacterium]|nr:SDR family oxidoreductase [Bacteroidales bacterium]